MSGDTDKEVAIIVESDIVLARRAVREAAHALGFGVTDSTRIVTAASELARNIFKYAGSGVMRLRALSEPDRKGLELSFIDQGPGIADKAKAMEEGFSTSKSLGMGLPGARRLMDEMELTSQVGKGTTVVVRKWRKG